MRTGAAFLAKAGLRTAMLVLAPFVSGGPPALVPLQIVIFIVAGAAGADIDATPPISNTAAHVIVTLHAINGLAIPGTSLCAFVHSLKHAETGSTVAAVTP